MKKSYKYLVGIVIVVIALVATMTIIFRNNDEKLLDTTDKKIQESFSLNGETTVSLIYYTKENYSKNSPNKNYYYDEENKLLVSSMKKDHLMNLIIYRLDRLGELEDGIVEEKLVKEQFKKVFGNNIKYKVLDSFEYKCGQIEYDSNKKEYVYRIENALCESSNIVTSSIASFKYNNRIEIVEAVGYIGEDGTYYDKELTNKISDEILDEYSIRDLGLDHLFKRYKYVFNYDEEADSYYFYSVERYEGDV